jgi:hypothetical protein
VHNLWVTLVVPVVDAAVALAMGKRGDRHLRAKMVNSLALASRENGPQSYTHFSNGTILVMQVSTF